MLCNLLNFLHGFFNIVPNEERCFQCEKNEKLSCLFNHKEQCKNCFHHFCEGCVELRHLPHTGVPVPVCFHCIANLNRNDHSIIQHRTDHPIVLDEIRIEKKTIENLNVEPITDIKETPIIVIDLPSPPINILPDNVIGHKSFPLLTPRPLSYHPPVVLIEKPNKDIPFDTGWIPIKKI